MHGRALLCITRVRVKLLLLLLWQEATDNGITACCGSRSSIV